MYPMVHNIEKYSSEKLFDENDMKFLNATEKWMTWLVTRGFDYYRTISESKYLIFQLLWNWKVFEIRDVFVACG